MGERPQGGGHWRLSVSAGAPPLPLFSPTEMLRVSPGKDQQVGWGGKPEGGLLAP